MCQRFFAFSVCIANSVTGLRICFITTILIFTEKTNEFFVMQWLIVYDI